jgi:hypothetical protein
MQKIDEDAPFQPAVAPSPGAAPKENFRDIIESPSKQRREQRNSQIVEGPCYKLGRGVLYRPWVKVSLSSQ